jgi:hypothetical protein
VRRKEKSCPCEPPSASPILARVKLTVETLPNKAIRRIVVLALVLGLAACQRAEQKNGAPRR